MQPKYLIPYLPYDLKVMYEDQTFTAIYISSKEIQVCTGVTIGWEYMGSLVKPILKPMSHAEEYFKQRFAKMAAHDTTACLSREIVLEYRLFDTMEMRGFCTQTTSYGTMQVLFKHHFDVFGLIDRGLAISESQIQY